MAGLAGCLRQGARALDLDMNLRDIPRRQHGGEARLGFAPSGGARGRGEGIGERPDSLKSDRSAYAVLVDTYGAPGTHGEPAA